MRPSSRRCVPAVGVALPPALAAVMGVASIVAAGAAGVGVGAALAAPVASAASAQPASWNFTQAGVTPAAQAGGRAGAGVAVAVLDTWVDGSDSELGGRVAAGVQCTSGTCTPGQTPDACTHGTHVAGTIASRDYGVAPAATIVPVQVLTYSNGSCTGTADAVVAGIDWVVDTGGPPRAQVINISLGDQIPELLQDQSVTSAVAAAAAAGIVVVAAAGNDDLSVANPYGSVGGAPAALLVAATGPSGALAHYSNYGGVSLAAPGGDSGGLGAVVTGACSSADCVLSTIPAGGTALMEGTSMAAPHVAGAAALLIGETPARGRVDTVDDILATASPLADAGSGVLDVAKAVAAESPAATSSPAGASGAGSSPAATTPASTARSVPAQSEPVPIGGAGSGYATTPVAGGAAPTSSATTLPGASEPSAGSGAGSYGDTPLAGRSGTGGATAGGLSRLASGPLAGEAGTRAGHGRALASGASGGPLWVRVVAAAVVALSAGATALALRARRRPRLA